MKSIRLHFQLFFAQKKYIYLFALFVFFIGFVLQFVVLPQLTEQNKEIRNALTILEREINLTRAPTSQNGTNVQNLKAFHNTLEQSDQVENTIQWLFELAKKSNITINKAQLKYSTNVKTNIDSTEIQLPVQGNYILIREFCEAFLLSTPFASMDEIRLKRSDENRQTIEATLRFTILTTKNQPSLSSKEAHSSKER